MVRTTSLIFSVDHSKKHSTTVTNHTRLKSSGDTGSQMTETAIQGDSKVTLKMVHQNPGSAVVFPIESNTQQVDAESDRVLEVDDAGELASSDTQAGPNKSEVNSIPSEAPKPQPEAGSSTDPIPIRCCDRCTEIYLETEVNDISPMVQGLLDEADSSKFRNCHFLVQL